MCMIFELEKRKDLLDRYKYLDWGLEFNLNASLRGNTEYNKNLNKKTNMLTIQFLNCPKSPA